MWTGFDLNGDGKVDQLEEYTSYKVWKEIVEDDKKRKNIGGSQLNRYASKKIHSKKK